MAETTNQKILPWHVYYEKGDVRNLASGHETEVLAQASARTRNEKRQALDIGGQYVVAPNPAT